MRTKVLICAAALAAVSAFTTMAQNVYSLNVVGYIQLPVVDGFNLVANQLDYDGTGLNNTPANVLGTNVPLQTEVYGWAFGTWNIAGLSIPRGSTTPSWTVVNGVMPTLNPGQGFWLQIPTGGAATISSNVTVVGQVDQGGLVNGNLATGGGFGLVSSIVPIAGGLTSVLHYTPTSGDETYLWNPTPAPGSWTINGYSQERGETSPQWNLVQGPTGAPAEPTPPIGAGFWIDSAATSSWSNYFTVQ